MLLVDQMDQYIVRGMITPLKEQFHVGDFAIGLLTSSFILVNGIITLPAGYLADRWHRTRTIGHTVLAWSGITALGAAAPNFPSLVGLRAALGFGSGSRSCRDGARARRGFVRLRSVFHIHADIGHARNLLERLSDFAHDGGIVVRREEETQPHLAIGGGRDVANHLGFEHVCADAVVPDARKSIRDALLEIRGHPVGSSVARTALSSQTLSLSCVSIP